jgi:hypothetical protein
MNEENVTNPLERFVIRRNDLYLTREYGVFCWGYKHSARIYKNKTSAERRAKKVNADIVEAL